MAKKFSTERKLTLQVLLRTVLIMSAMFLLSMILAGYLSHRRHHREIMSVIQQRGASVGESIARMMGASGGDVMLHGQSFVESTANDPLILHVDVVRNDSTIVFSSTPELAGQKIHPASAPGCRYCHAAMPRSDDRQIEYITRDGHDAVHYIYPIENEPSCQGCHDPNEPRRATVVAELSLTEAGAVLDQPSHVMYGAVAILLIAFIAATYRLLDSVTFQPLELTAKRLKRLAAGDFETIPDSSRRDIIGFIDYQINRAARRLREQYEQLETEVEKRTKALRRSQKALTAERDKLQFVFDHSPQGFATVGVDRTVQVANQMAASILGTDLAVLVGSNVDDFDVLSEAFAPEHLGTEGGDPFAGDAVGRSCTIIDKPRHIEVHTSRLETASGGDVYLVMLDDITDRRKIDQHLERHERLASIGRLASGVAHEVGNPLSAISSLVQITRKLKEPEAIENNCDLIQSHIARITTIVRNLSTTARLPEDDSIRVDATDIARGAVEIASWDKRAAHTQFDFQHGANLNPVLLPRDQMLQALLNVILNALDALQEAKEPVIRVAVSQRDDGCVIAISDNGAGIPESDLRRIFDPFFTTKPVGMGTGLGLAVTHRVVTKLGGEIRVSSELGKGTTFSMTIPRMRDEGSDRG